MSDNFQQDSASQPPAARNSSLFSTMLIFIVLVIVFSAARIIFIRITKTVDRLGGARVVVECLPPNTSILKSEKVEMAAHALKKRLDPKNELNVRIERKGDRFISIDIPGMLDESEARSLIVDEGKLEFFDTNGVRWEDGYIPPKNTPVILTGNDLESVSAGSDNYGHPAVHFQFKKDASVMFGKYTSRNINNYMAVSFNGKIISCPVITSAIFGGSGIISGKFTKDDVQRMVGSLTAGQMPVKLKIVEMKIIKPKKK